MSIETRATGRFGVMLLQAIEKKSLDLKKMAMITDTTYEHMRKLVMQATFPSPHLLKTLCKELGMNLAEAQKAVVTERLQKKYGSITSVLAGKNPELEPIEREWPYLEEWMKTAVYQTVKNFARQARENETAKAKR